MLIDGETIRPRTSFVVLENLRSHFIFLKENMHINISFYEIFSEFSSHGDEHLEDERFVSAKKSNVSGEETFLRREETFISRKATFVSG